MLGFAHSPVKMPHNIGQDGKIPGGWGTPFNSPYGEALPELIGAFSGFRYSCIRKSRDFTCWSILKGRKCIISVSKKGQKGEQIHFAAVKKSQGPHSHILMTGEGGGGPTDIRFIFYTQKNPIQEYKNPLRSLILFRFYLHSYLKNLCQKLKRW